MIVVEFLVGAAILGIIVLASLLLGMRVSKHDDKITQIMDGFALTFLIMAAVYLSFTIGRLIIGS